MKQLVMVHGRVCCLLSDEFVRDDMSELISYLSVECVLSLFSSVYCPFLSTVYPE